MEILFYETRYLRISSRQDTKISRAPKQYAHVLYMGKLVALHPICAGRPPPCLTLREAS